MMGAREHRRAASSQAVTSEDVLRLARALQTASTLTRRPWPSYVRRTSNPVEDWVVWHAQSLLGGADA
jgi:hypothetical protein